MTIAKKLNEIKDAIIADRENKVKCLERNRPKFTAHPEQLKAYDIERHAALAAMSLAQQRGTDFRVKIGLNYQCPRCCIVSGARSTLHPKNIGTRTKDFWGCDACGLKLEVPFGI